MFLDRIGEEGETLEYAITDDDHDGYKKETSGVGEVGVDKNKSTFMIVISSKLTSNLFELAGEVPRLPWITTS